MIEDAQKAQAATIIDTAKMFFLIGAQAMEVSHVTNVDIDIAKVWSMMMTSEDVDNIKKNRELFLQAIFIK